MTEARQHGGAASVSGRRDVGQAKPRFGNIGALLWRSVMPVLAGVAVFAVLAVMMLPSESRIELLQLLSGRAAPLVFAAVAAVAAGGTVAYVWWKPLLAFVPALTHWLERLRVHPDVTDATPEMAPPALAHSVQALADAYRQRERARAAEIAAATEQLAIERDLFSAVLADLPAAVIGCSRDGRVLFYTPRATQLVAEAEAEIYLGLGRTIFALFRRSAIVHALDRLDDAIQLKEARPCVSALLPTRSGALLHARFTPLLRPAGFFLHLSTLDTAADDSRAERWPLEDIAVDTLVPMVARALTAEADVPIGWPSPLPQLWLFADSFSLIALLRGYVQRWRFHQGEAWQSATWSVEELGDSHVSLQLRWMPACTLPEPAWKNWLCSPLSPLEERLPLTPADVIQGHGGELVQQLEADAAVLRLQLPRAPSPPVAIAAELPTCAVPLADPGSSGLLRCSLFTVFDTETTGLDPSAGDEVISVGAIRVVDARLVSGEVFETLVSSNRGIDPAAQRVHGIDAQMLRGQPSFEVAMSRFLQFSEDTILVGHNVAFDLRFFELQGQPVTTSVLDTMLLSQVVYPVPEGHTLEALAQRLGVSVIGRHTALGDAIVTAEVLLRLLPLLEAKGVRTLEDALAASSAVPLARVRY